MIRVTIELIPFGDENTRRRILGTAKIANTGQGSETSGQYIFQLKDKGGRRWKTGYVNGFPRTRLLAWDLLYRALRSALSDRNKEKIT
jgi:hypothetical protein